MEIEELDAALDYPTLTVTTVALGNERFARYRRVEGLCTIEWWSNTCYLIMGDLIVPFKHVEQRNTWPNGAIMNLQFYDANREVCAILKIE